MKKSNIWTRLWNAIFPKKEKSKDEDYRQNLILLTHGEIMRLQQQVDNLKKEIYNLTNITSKTFLYILDMNRSSPEKLVEINRVVKKEQSEENPFERVFENVENPSQNVDTSNENVDTYTQEPVEDDSEEKQLARLTGGHFQKRQYRVYDEVHNYRFKFQYYDNDWITTYDAQRRLGVGGKHIARLCNNNVIKNAGKVNINGKWNIVVNYGELRKYFKDKTQELMESGTPKSKCHSCGKKYLKLYETHLNCPTCTKTIG